MIAFALPGLESLAPVESATRGALRVERFENGELSLRLETDPRGEPCLLVGSVAPPDGQLLSLLLAAHTLRGAWAAAVTALLPYLGYARQDRPEAGREPAIAWVGRLLSACGVNRVVTVDAHSAEALDLLAPHSASLSPAPLFAAELSRAGLLEATIVAPDQGAVERSREVSEAAGMKAPVTHMRKERTAVGVVHREVVGRVGRRAVVIDDILDTGGTLLSCCRELQRRGVEGITVMVTHGLFAGKRWKVLQSLGVDRIYVTDSVPSAALHASESVWVLPVLPLLEQAVSALADEQNRDAGQRCRGRCPPW